jgi:hypothetical protein
MSIEKQQIGKFELECCGGIRRLVVEGVGDIEFSRSVLSFQPKGCCDISFNLQKDSHLYTKKIFFLEMSKEPLKEQVNSIALFQNFLKYSHEIVSENSCFISEEDKESRIFLCQVFIELLEENKFNLSQAYSYTYLMLLELNLKLIEDRYKSDKTEESTNELYDALRKWLSVCQNSQYTSFESKKLNREDKIDKALFKDGKPKVGLKEYTKEDPRFRDLIRNTADNWYLKARYNLWIAGCLFWSVNNKGRLLNCLLPRMFSAIVVGYIPLVMQGDVWKLAYCMFYHNTVWIVMPLLLIVSFAYLYIEISRISVNKRKTIWRAFCILSIGLLEALLVGFILCPLISIYFSPTTLSIEEEVIKLAIEPVNCLGYPQAFFLFFPLAMFIGIFIQIIWEDKPITHPL